MDSSEEDLPTQNVFHVERNGKSITAEGKEDVSDAASEVSSNASLKRKLSTRGGTRKQASKSRGRESNPADNLVSSSDASEVVIPENKLFVGRIPLYRTEKELYEPFRQIGAIKGVRLMKKGNGMSRVRKSLKNIAFRCLDLKH